MKQNRIIGIDIGGSKIKGILRSGGKITRDFRAKTPKAKKEFVAVLNNLFAKLSENKRISAIGIGSAGVVKGNKVVWSPNIPCLKNFSFRDVFKQPIKLKVDNDARSFLRGEYKISVNPKIKKIMGFTVGTGIGRAFAENGKVKKIKKFEYPEKWEKQYQKIRDKKDDDAFAKFLAAKLSPIIKKYKPDLIILGGGAMDRKNFIKKLEIKLAGKSVKTKIKKAVLGDYSAAVGSASLFR